MSFVCVCVWIFWNNPAAPSPPPAKRPVCRIPTIVGDPTGDIPIASTITLDSGGSISFTVNKGSVRDSLPQYRIYSPTVPGVGKQLPKSFHEISKRRVHATQMISSRKVIVPCRSGTKPGPRSQSFPHKPQAVSSCRPAREKRVIF